MVDAKAKPKRLQSVTWLKSFLYSIEIDMEIFARKETNHTIIYQPSLYYIVVDWYQSNGGSAGIWTPNDGFEAQRDIQFHHKSLKKVIGCSFCSRLCSTLNGSTSIPVESVKGSICTIHSDANNHFPNSLNFVGVNTPPTGQSSMVVMLGLEPRLGTNLVLLVYKTSDANITSHDHSYNQL